MHVSNLFYTEPGMRLAERLAGSSLGGKVFFCNSGAEANEAAIKLARRARPGGDIVVVSGAFHGRTYGALSATPQESKQAPFAPLVPGFRAVAAEAEALAAAVDGAHRGGAARADPGRERRPRAVARGPARRARRLRRARRRADLRRGPVRHGPHRHPVGLSSSCGVVPDAMTVAKALGGGLPIGALVDRRPPGRRAAAGRPRLDVRRGTGRGCGRARGAGADERCLAAGPRRRARRPAGARGCGRSRASSRSGARGLMLACDVGRGRAGRGAAGAARVSAW